ncbi:MAG: CARDB domain-containing protein, partial [Candidatus Aminicenantes bacterium]
TISRTGNTSADIEVNFTISGSATAGEDYTPIAESVTIHSGSEEATVTITPIDDLLAEWDETVTMTLLEDPDYITSGTNTATITIESDELISDLIVSSLTVPTIGGAGENISIAETTKNQGEGSADPSTTQFYLSENTSFDSADILIGGRSVPVLASGASSTTTTTLSIPSGTEIGFWYIIARADALEAVVETAEGNNTYTRTINIGPDMRIISLSAPISTGTEQTVTITETTKNQGGGTAGPTTTEFYLSLNTLVDESDTPLGSRSIPSLAPGASHSGSTSVIIPADVAVGSYYVLAKADSEDTVIETSEGNNTYARVIKIGPDLNISALSVPSTAGPGENITITETTKNLGGASTGPSTTQFYLSENSSVDESDTLLGSRSVPSLAPGASNSGSTIVTIPSDSVSGSVYILALADGENVVDEISETNNKYGRLIKIGTDLHISSFSAPTTAGPGQNMTLTDTTKNQGGATAEASTTQFYLSANSTVDESDTVLGSRSVPSLAPGASSLASTTVTIPADTDSGSYYLIALADAEDVVIETSETNNMYTRVIKIGTDLRVSYLSAPSTGGAGQNISITDTTKNQGGGTADPSETQFFLSANTLVDASDTLLGSRSIPSLAPGASSSGSTTVLIPSNTVAGRWYIIAKADGEDVVVETSETNNTYSRLINIGTDLRISSLTMPSATGAGLSITVSDTTKNYGGGPANPSTTFIYLSANTSVDASDILIGTRNVPALAAGASNSGSTAVTIPVDTIPGGWYIIALADGEDVVFETSETNNKYARFIKIGPDMRVTAVSSPTSADAGQNITINETTKNQGGGAADPTTTHFYLSTNTVFDASDILLGSRSIPALSAGTSNSGSTSVTIPADTASGTRYILAIADGEDVVAEVYETNNKYARYIRIN